MRKLIGLSALAAAMLGFVPTTRAAPIVFTASLSGPNEDPPNTSPGTGFTVVEFDPVAHTLRVQATFSGLLSTTTAAHIHTPTPTPLTGVAGVATQTPSFASFPLGVMAGSFNQTLDTLSALSYNPAFITANSGTVAGAEAALAAGLASGRAYLNIHTAAPLGFPGGEIRGFLQAVPEPSTLCSACLGGAGLIGYAFRRRKGGARKSRA